ncbi:hypothetical protein [Caballeronia sp. SL2Y3]|uniref:hypothetical protein n=1 Tax=Caballeronia sp. SL2Y3 TaxID=2878151 RepID=UPI001FD06CDE|nr:hypothetical protein [Caballeronia sp. SL2Y3]
MKFSFLLGAAARTERELWLTMVNMSPFESLAFSRGLRGAARLLPAPPTQAVLASALTLRLAYSEPVAPRCPMCPGERQFENRLMGGGRRRWSNTLLDVWSRAFSSSASRRVAPVSAFLAMNRSHSIWSAVALAACLTSYLLSSATPSRAAEPLPDPHILSAVPFVFTADSGIFSPMPVSPTDSRIFSPLQTPGNRETVNISEARNKRPQFA